MKEYGQKLLNYKGRGCLKIAALFGMALPKQSMPELREISRDTDERLFEGLTIGTGLQR